ncbi:MAG TPA: MarR family transcriptional regulator [Acidimicrobiales bacterium]|nr:MarR family transcriptional regulator [Acidimicrobiales bacterium]
MDEVAWLDELEMRAWRSLLAAHRRLLQRLDTELQQSQDLSVSDYGVLVELSEAEGGAMRMSELADRLLLSPSGLTRRLDNLVEAGLVDRVRCQQDRRGTFAVLTESGRRRLERAAPDHVDQVRRHFVERLSRAQLQQLADALGVIAEGELCPQAGLGGPAPATTAPGTT